MGRSAKLAYPRSRRGLGGQRDYKGKTLRKIDAPDYRVRLTTPACSCGLLDQGKLWAGEIKVFLLDLYKRSEKGTKTVPEIALEKQKWLELCQKAIQIEELILPITAPLEGKKKRGRKVRGKALALLDR